MRRWRQRLERGCHSGGIPGATRSCKRQRRIFLQAFSGSVVLLPTPWFQTSNQQNSKRINFCCFKSPSLWFFDSARRLTYSSSVFHVASAKEAWVVQEGSLPRWPHSHGWMISTSHQPWNSWIWWLATSVLLHLNLQHGWPGLWFVGRLFFFPPIAFCFWW